MADAKLVFCLPPLTRLTPAFLASRASLGFSLSLTLLSLVRLCYTPFSPLSFSFIAPLQIPLSLSFSVSLSLHSECTSAGAGVFLRPPSTHNGLHLGQARRRRTCRRCLRLAPQLAGGGTPSPSSAYFPHLGTGAHREE